MRRDNGVGLALGAVGALAAMATISSAVQPRVGRRGGRNTGRYVPGELDLRKVKYALLSREDRPPWWEVDDNDHNFSWSWWNRGPASADDRCPILYATPNSEGEPGISFELGDMDSMTVMQAPVRWTGNEARDIQLYLDECFKYLRAVDTIFAHSPADMARFLAALNDVVSDSNRKDDKETRWMLRSIRGKNTPETVAKAYQLIASESLRRQKKARMIYVAGGRPVPTLGQVRLRPADVKALGLDLK